jgi:hypothetical protein
MRAPRLLLLRLGGLHGALFGAGAGEAVVAAGIERQLAVLQMQDRPTARFSRPRSWLMISTVCG